MWWFATPSGKPGHPERFSAVAIPFCLSMKILFGLPLRQTTGFVEILAALSDRLALLPVGAGLDLVLQTAGLRLWAGSHPDAGQARADLLRLEAEAAEFEGAHRDLKAASGDHGETAKVFPGWLEARDNQRDFDRRAEPISFILHYWCSLTEASDRLQMTFPGIIDEIRSGRIGRVGKYVQRSGFASVVINLGHLGQEGEAISIETFAFSLGLRPAELITFVRRNNISCQQMAGARGSAQLRMSAADRQAFHDRFISFRALGIAAGLGWDVLQARLDASGIGPAGGSARIYCRAEISHLLP